MWCWRRTDRLNNEAVLHRVKEKRNIFHTIWRRKANWIGHLLRRNCLLKHIIEGKIRGTRRRGGRRKQPLNDLKEVRRYWKLKEEAQDRTLWRTQFERGYEPVERQTTYLTLVETNVQVCSLPQTVTPSYYYSSNCIYLWSCKMWYLLRELLVGTECVWKRTICVLKDIVKRGT
jgi:hypothetical protein